MAKEKVIIRSLNPTQTIYFNATINYLANPPAHASEWAKKYAGKTIHISQDFQIFETKTPPENYPPWSVRFDSSRTSFFIEWESGSDLKKEQDKATAVRHLAYQQSMKPLFGEPNTNLRGEAFFSLEYEGMKNTYLADLNDKKFAVYKKFRAYSPEEKRDCAFYYNLNASGMKHSELIAKMADFETGRLMLPNNKVDGMPMMDHFIENYGQEHVTVVKMIAEKALVYGQIQKRDNGIFLDQEFIGTSMENVYSYLESNKEKQRFLSTQVRGIDAEVEDDMEEREEPELREPKNLDDLKKWRDLGDKAGVKMARVSGIELIKERLVILAQKKKIDHTQDPEKIAEELIDMKKGLVNA